MRPPVARTVHLQKLDPMWVPHVWSAIRDALLSAYGGGPGNKVMLLAITMHFPRYLPTGGAITCYMCGAQKAEVFATRLIEMLTSGRQDSGAEQDSGPCLPPCIQVCVLRVLG